MLSIAIDGEFVSVFPSIASTTGTKYWMQDQKLERGPRGSYARLICRGCRARKIKCMLPSHVNFGQVGTAQPKSASCERCRHLDLECIVERTYTGRAAGKRTTGAVPSKSPNSGRSTSPPSNSDSNEAAKLSESIRRYLFTGAMDGNPMVQSSRDNLKSASGEDDLYHSITNTNAFIALTLAKDPSFGSSIHMMSTWDTSLTDLVSHELAIAFDNLLLWQRFFVLGIPSLVNLRERLLSTDPNINNVATKLLFAVLCLSAYSKSKQVCREDDSLRQRLQQAVSSYGQDFIFCPPTHDDSILLCRFLSIFNPTALATSQRVAHISVKAELYINIAHRVADRLGILPESGCPSFAGTLTFDSAEMERKFILSIQGLQIIADEFLLRDFFLIPPHAFRNILQRMQPHIHAYQDLLQTPTCSPIMVFHIKWTTATYMQIEAMAEAKQHWMNPSRLFIVIDEGEKKCLSEINSTYEALSEASELGAQIDQSEMVAVCSLLEMRFHAIISKLFGIGLFYTSLSQARAVTGQVQSSAELRQDEVTRMGDVVINNLLTAPEDQRNTPFFTFLRHFGGQYPDKLQGILAKFVECTSMRLRGNAHVAPIRPVVLEIVNHCKNILENNLFRFKTSGRLHANFDKQIGLFTQCAKQLAAMVSPAESLHKAFQSGCMYSGSSKMIYGLCDIMNSLKRQASLVQEWDRTTSVVNKAAFPHGLNVPELSSGTEHAPTVHFNSLEAWNLGSYLDTPDQGSPTQHIFDWDMQPRTVASFSETSMHFTQ